LKNKNTPGWLCAQKRPARGLIKAIRAYQTQGDDNESHFTSLPDYLIIVDDDTYYNMEHFSRYNTFIPNNQVTILRSAAMAVQ